MTKNYKCYGCSCVVDYDSLAAECMCVHKEDPKYRGICLSCKQKTPDDWDNKPGPEHHIQKVHTWNPEYKEWWCHIEEEVGRRWGSCSMEDDIITFPYFEGPEGQKGDEFRKWFVQDHGIEIVFCDQTVREEYTKYKTFERFKGKICICCD